LTDRLALWASDGWRVEALRWVDARLAEVGARRTGAATGLRVRPWATVFTTTTTIGAVWLKAMAPGTAFEARLYPLLVRLVPEYVLHPVAVDVDRGWVLLPDGGPSVHDRLRGAARMKATVSAVRRYADLQRRLAPHLAELLATGITDMRPAVVPRRWDEALAWAGEGVRPDVRALGPQVADWAARLADAPGAASLDHNDLHQFNLLGDESSIRFYDWGDSFVSHPFASLAVALEFTEPDDRAAVRDAYLEQYADLGPHDELVGIAVIACRVAQIARTLANARAYADVNDPERADAAEELNKLAEDGEGAQNLRS
jgi:hypothetical protein